MLLVSMDCLHPVSCVPNVASVSLLSSSCIFCSQCCQCLWIVFILYLLCPMLPVSLIFILHLLCPMLPVSLDCPFLIGPLVFSNVYLLKKRQARQKQKHCNLGSGLGLAQRVTGLNWLMGSYLHHCPLITRTQAMFRDYHNRPFAHFLLDSKKKKKELSIFIGVISLFVIKISSNFLQC